MIFYAGTFWKVRSLSSTRRRRARVLRPRSASGGQVVVRGGCGLSRHRWDSLAENMLNWRMEDMGVLKPYPIFYVYFRISSVLDLIYTFSLTIAISIRALEGQCTVRS